MSEIQSPIPEEQVGEEAEKYEEFYDANKFLNASILLSYVTPPEPLMSRLSLFRKFDPLFAARSNVKCHDQQGVTEDETVPKKCPMMATAESGLSGGLQTDAPDVLNKDVLSRDPKKRARPRPSIEKTLSPNVEDVSNIEEEELPKVFTEDEMLNSLMTQKLAIQDEFLKKTRELEKNFIKKQQELEDKLDRQKRLSNFLYAELKQSIDLCASSEAKKQLQEQLETAEEELKELDASVEDIQYVEATFF